MAGGIVETMPFLDQYSVRIEKDAALAVFDRTNVFTLNKTIEQMEYTLARGIDYEKFLKVLSMIFDKMNMERLETCSADK